MLLKLLKSIFAGKAHWVESDLERYIIARNPQTLADVERLTKQYDLAVRKGFFV